jgi:hypothetical protein
MTRTKGLRMSTSTPAVDKPDRPPASPTKGENQEFRLGCFTHDATVPSLDTVVDRVPSYEYAPARATRPQKGTRREKVRCPKCGEEVTVEVASLSSRASRAKDLLFGRPPFSPKQSIVSLVSLLVSVAAIVFLALGGWEGLLFTWDEDWAEFGLLVVWSALAVAIVVLIRLFRPGGPLPSIVEDPGRHDVSAGRRSGLARGVDRVPPWLKASLFIIGVLAVFFGVGFLYYGGGSTDEKGIGKPAPVPFVPPTFTLDRVEPQSGGEVRVTATLPKRGSITAGDKADKRVGPTVGGGHPFEFPILLIARTIPVRGAGETRFTLRPTEEARALLEERASLKAKVKVAYTPKGRAYPEYQTADVTLEG